MKMEQINSELSTQEQILVTLESINHRVGGSWMALWRGLLTGFGGVIGAFIAVLIIGWVLNIVGIIPALRQQATAWRDSLQQAQQRQLPSSSR